MLKRTLTIFALIFALILCACSGASWNGFYEEELSDYLELGKYKGLSYEALDASVSDGEVDSVIDTMLQSMAELRAADKAADGSMAVKFDRYCFVNGVSMPDLSEEGGLYALYTDYDDPVIGAVLQGLIGHKKGDILEINVTLPANYKGITEDETEATYRVTVIEIYERIVPELSDSTAAQLIAGCGSVDELRSRVRRDLEREKTEGYVMRVESKLKEEIIVSSKLKKTPLSVLNEYYDDTVTLYERLAEAKEVPLEDYLKSELGMTLDELEVFATELALKKTKEALVLYSIVKLENITVTDAALAEFADKMASQSLGIFESGEEYMSYYGKNAVTEDYLWSRVLETVRGYGRAE